MAKGKNLFGFFVLFFVTATTSFGQTENDFTVALTESGDGVVITSYLGRKEKITIPATIQGMPVKEIGESAFYHYVKFIGSKHNDLVEIVIPNGVTVIGWGAFSHCERLKKVTLPASLLKIKGDAFSGCTELTSIIIPMYCLSRTCRF
jgi:hypothetical protein